ncbi:hypothetical protein HMPREF9141_1107 [Prevotella multiformis DSM 16608]|uniref:Uncharacterized protein n=1 Tax=Prevotella multiformis DSM 16608 TaxID=888743 RepID=F0F690_9BACT|nr:hypothetical protein HMPREF9141_1107 [Prevotella multiformis DSM 16608]
MCKDTKIFENNCKQNRKTYEFLQTPHYKPTHHRHTACSLTSLYRWRKVRDRRKNV